MQDIQTARYALLFGVVLVFAVSIAQCEGDSRPAPAAAQPQPSTPSAVPRGLGLSRGESILAWQACMHETDYVGGTAGTADCGALMQVIENSRRGAETFGAALLRRMPRFAARTDRRPWIRELTPGRQLRDPPHWPYVHVHVGHYEAQMSSVWSRVLRFAHGVEELPCNYEPVEWFGRATDGQVIAARLATGRYVEANCSAGGPRTVQAYLAFVDLD